MYEFDTSSLTKCREQLRACNTYESQKIKHDSGCLSQVQRAHSAGLELASLSRSFDDLVNRASRKIRFTRFLLEKFHLLRLVHTKEKSAGQMT